MLFEAGVDMTWHTPIGERVIRGSEGRLLRAALGRVVDVVQMRIADPDQRIEWGVRVFDEMSPGSQLAVLADVASAMFLPTERCSDLTAISEGTVSVLYLAIAEMVEYEINAPRESCWRSMVIDALSENGNMGEFPDPECKCMDEWDEAFECLSEMILWDNDFHDGGEFLDGDPACLKPIQEMLGIDRDYYCAVPPDPRESEIGGIVVRLRAICEA